MTPHVPPTRTTHPDALPHVPGAFGSPGSSRGQLPGGFARSGQGRSGFGNGGFGNGSFGNGGFGNGGFGNGGFGGGMYEERTSPQTGYGGRNQPESRGFGEDDDESDSDDSESDEEMFFAVAGERAAQSTPTLTHTPNLPPKLTPFPFPPATEPEPKPPPEKSKSETLKQRGNEQMLKDDYVGAVRPAP